MENTTTSPAHKSRICLLCNENEPPDGNNICDPCFDNAGELMERKAELYAAVPDLLEACSEACDLLSDMDDEESLAVFVKVSAALNKAKHE
jgi:hypothetical protein